MISAGLATVLNLLTASLNTCLCNATCNKARRDYADKHPIDITAEVQGNYPNFKQKLAEKNLVNSKVSKSQLLLDKDRLRA